MPRESDLDNVTTIDDNTFYRIVTEDGNSRNVLGSILKQYLGEGTATPFLEVVASGDDTGIVCTEQFSVGSPQNPKEAVFGGGDSYPVGTENSTPNSVPQDFSASHCTMANTTGSTIVSAVDRSVILASYDDSTIGLFGGADAGNYILVGSDANYNGGKVKINTAGSIDPENVIGEYLYDTDTWIEVPYMAAKADYPYTQFAHYICNESGTSEQWRFGFDPDNVPTPWNKVTLNINGVDYTKYWSRFRLSGDITTDAVIEQVKLNPNKFEVNKDGVRELFGLARRPMTLISGVDSFINNTASSPANQDVSYESGVTVADTNDNQFNNNAVDSGLLIQNIETGLDTSIPLQLYISYYVEGNATGDVEWEAKVYKVSDGFKYDGSATPTTYSTISTTSVSSNYVRKTAKIKIFINELTNQDAIMINLTRDATGANADDTLAANCVVTNIRLVGYFWM